MRRSYNLAAMAAAFLGFLLVSTPVIVVGQPVPDGGDGTKSQTGTAHSDKAVGDTGSASTDASDETSIHGGWLVIVSYIVLWLGLLGYVAFLASRQRRVAKKIDSLESRIDELFEASVDED